MKGERVREKLEKVVGDDAEVEDEDEEEGLEVGRGGGARVDGDLVGWCGGGGA